jgi:hypothetical protein
VFQTAETGNFGRFRFPPGPAYNIWNSLGFDQFSRPEVTLLLFCHCVTETQRKDWESPQKMVNLVSPNSRQRFCATARAEWYASVKEEK